MVVGCAGVMWSEEGELGRVLVSALLAEGRSKDALALIKAGALAAPEAAADSSTELQVSPPSLPHQLPPTRHPPDRPPPP